MIHTLIPQASLQKTSKVLFITHLALGDFAYLQNCFQAFARAFPHLEIHLWVDEVRRTDDSNRFEQLKNYALYDWVGTCAYFSKVYNRTYSPALYRESIAQAQQEHYPIVVSLATLRPHRYAALAREISPDGFVAGIKAKFNIFKAHHCLAYAKLDAAILPYSGDRKNLPHISAVHADWFRQLSGLEIAPADRMPSIDIPEEWAQDAQRQLLEWNFPPANGKLVFINVFAKTKKRCWPLARAVELIKAMQQRPEWRDTGFIVNAMPENLAATRRTIEEHALPRTSAFSADKNFFQLPAMLARCDLIISVETAVMHLANAVHVPVIALMRTKNPEWAPIDSANSTVVTAAHRRDWVDAISAEQVMKVLR